MKLRNKKTGEIIELTNRLNLNSGSQNYGFESLSELNEEWEDYEEPKEFYFITESGEIYSTMEFDDISLYKEIGNYFETKEEAEKAVEKLKALKRLKDKGFKFEDWFIDEGLQIEIATNFDKKFIGDKPIVRQNLNLLFGGEE